MGERARLKWQCRRGMRELDVLLERYIERRYDQAPPRLQDAFQALLTEDTPALLAYLTGRARPPSGDMEDVIAEIRDPN